MAKSWCLKNALSNEVQEIELWTRERAKFCPLHWWGWGWESHWDLGGSASRERGWIWPLPQPHGIPTETHFWEHTGKGMRAPSPLPLPPSGDQRKTQKCYKTPHTGQHIKKRGMRYLKLCWISSRSSSALLGKTAPCTRLPKSWPGKLVQVNSVKNKLPREACLTGSQQPIFKLGSVRQTGGVFLQGKQPMNHSIKHTRDNE